MVSVPYIPYHADDILTLIFTATHAERRVCQLGGPHRSELGAFRTTCMCVQQTSTCMAQTFAHLGGVYGFGVRAVLLLCMYGVSRNRSCVGMQRTTMYSVPGSHVHVYWTSP